MLVRRHTNDLRTIPITKKVANSYHFYDDVVSISLLLREIKNMFYNVM